MSFIAAGIMAAGAIAGAGISAKGAKDSAKTAKKGSNKEIEFNREAMNIARADTRHSRQAGATALNALMSMTGLSGGGGGAQYDENGWPTENPGGALMPALDAPQGPAVGPEQMAQEQGQDWRSSAYAPVMGRASGGPMGQNTLYNINEMGPENVYQGGAISRNQSPMTVSGGGYVEPNIEGRSLGGVMALKRKHDRQGQGKIGALPGTDWTYNDRGKIAKTGYGHWNNDLGAYVDRRGRRKQNQVAPPEGYQDPSTQTDVDTTQGTDYNFQTDPGYRFRFEEGQRALDRGAAARGGLLSGGYARKAIRYGQGFASNEYSNVYNRIAAIAGMGQTANQHAGNAAQYGGSAMGTAAAQGGYATAYGQQGAGNAWANAGNQIAQLPWGRVFPGSGGGSPVGGPVDYQGYGGTQMGPPNF